MVAPAAIAPSITPAAVQAETIAAIEAATAGWVTPTATVLVEAPSITAALAAALPAVVAPAALPEFIFNAAADSQVASSALGITGAQAAAAAVVPAAVNLGSLGGIVSTAAPTAGWVGDLINRAGAAVAREATAVVTQAAKAAVLSAVVGNNNEPAGRAPLDPNTEPNTASTANPAPMLALLLAAAAVLLN